MSVSYYLLSSLWLKSKLNSNSFHFWYLSLFDLWYMETFADHGKKKASRFEIYFCYTFLPWKPLIDAFTLLCLIALDWVTGEVSPEKSAKPKLPLL